LFQEMVGCLFDEANPILSRIEAALDRGDGAEIADAAHRLKGTVVYLGAGPAATATIRVEQIGRAGNLSQADDAIRQLAGEIQRLESALTPYRRGP
jgi:HPt (histidine-containing phosphotransfer) domain-containing protein